MAPCSRWPGYGTNGPLLMPARQCARARSLWQADRAASPLAFQHVSLFDLPQCRVVAGIYAALPLFCSGPR
jgi:hypothetical protein